MILGRHGHDCMVVGFTTTCAISAYHHSWRGVLDTTLCDNVCQWLSTGRVVSLGSPVSSTNKTDLHDIIEILLKVALSSITSLVWFRQDFHLFRIHCDVKCLNGVQNLTHAVIRIICNKFHGNQLLKCNYIWYELEVWKKWKSTGSYPSEVQSFKH